jgi:hypothetical protein
VLEPYSDEEKKFVIALLKKYSPGLFSQDDEHLISIMRNDFLERLPSKKDKNLTNAK